MRPLFVVNLFHKLMRDRQVTAEARQDEVVNTPLPQYVKPSLLPIPQSIISGTRQP